MERNLRLRRGWVVDVETISGLGSQPSVLRMQDVVIGLPSRRLRRVVVPAALGLLLAVLILVPILFMFLGSVRSAALADPSAHFTFGKIIQVYTTQPYLRMLGFSLAIAAIVGAIATV